MKSSLSAVAAPSAGVIKVGLVSLGCAKNLVDSEIMAGHLHQAGMALTPNPDEADVMIVNTCSFIDAAKEESIGAILDANRDRGMRRRHHGQKLIVAGCMAQRFAGELRTSMPEVDAFIGLDQLTQIAPIIEGLLAKERESELGENFVTLQPKFIPDFDTPRFRLTPSRPIPACRPRTGKTGSPDFWGNRSLLRGGSRECRRLSLRS